MFKFPEGDPHHYITMVTTAACNTTEIGYHAQVPIKDISLYLQRENFASVLCQ